VKNRVSPEAATSTTLITSPPTTSIKSVRGYANEL
jgi:hypothetical protein